MLPTKQLTTDWKIAKGGAWLKKNQLMINYYSYMLQLLVVTLIPENTENKQSDKDGSGHMHTSNF